MMYSTVPLLELAGVDHFNFRWPDLDDCMAFHAAFNSRGGEVRFWAVLLNRLCGLPMPAAMRIAMAHRPAVAGMVREVFRTMRASLPSEDPRLDDQLVAILAREAS